MMDILEMDGSLSSSQKTYVRITREATQAGLDLIKDLLDVHMLEENVEPNYTTFDLAAFLLEKIKAFTPIAESKKIHLHISKVYNESVYLDEGYTSRIVDNLLSNAIKFSKRESTVEVAAGKENGQIWIAVRDQGPGFTQHDKDQLFQKFKKLSARPTAGESSNGLGLAIVKILVDRMKGTIDLKSELRKGSEFIIRFPDIQKN
jgi:signal transduction histidine kinase